MNITSIPTSKANILVVDDIKANLDFLSRMLTEYGYEARCVVSGSMALRVAESAWADIILLDIKMPELDGYEVCQLLRAIETTREVPIIFLTALEDLAHKKKAFAVGGSDYITKPFEMEEVVIRIENQLAVKSVKESVLELETIDRQLKQEIAQRKQAEERLLQMALYDQTTGLANRNSLISRLKQALQLTKTQPDYSFALLLIDCDRDGEIKQSLGYIARKKLTIAIGNSLTSSIPKSSFLSLFEDREFAI